MNTFMDNYIESLSISNKSIILAIHKGYRVTNDGNIIGVMGFKLKLFPNNSGYLKFQITTTAPECKNRTVFVHRIQAFRKFGFKLFGNDIEVRHIDDNKINNSWENIIIGSRSDNIMDRPQQIRKRAGQISGGSTSPLNAEDVDDIRRKVRNNNYDTYQSLAESYNLKSGSTISKIILRKRWNWPDGKRRGMRD